MPIYQKAFLAIGACAMSACASGNLETPAFASKDFVSAFQVMKSARCEVNAAAARLNSATQENRVKSSMKFSKVNMDFVLQAVETQGASGAPKVVLPVDGSTVTLGGSFGRTNKGTRLINFTFVHNVNNQLDCSDDLLEGGLGVESWLDLAQRATTGTFQPTKLSQKVTFEIKRDAKGEPSVERSIGSGSRSLSGTFTNNRDLKHEVNLTIIPDAAVPKKPANPKAAAITADTFRQEALDNFIQRFDDDSDDE